MKILILFASKYGATEKCAKLLAEKLEGEVKIVNLKENKNILLSDYDKIIVGSSVYAGSIQAQVKSFCIQNLDSLMNKPFSLFLSCMSSKKSEIQSYVEKSFPSELINHAIAIDSLGAVLNANKMNFFEKLILKMVNKSKNKTEESGVIFDDKNCFSTISNEKILEFANRINS